MAAVTLLGSATFNTTSGTHTVTATPAVGDLIVLVTANTGNTAATAPTDNNSGGAGVYTLITSALKASSADLVSVWVRTAPISSASSTVFTHAPGTSTGGGLAVLKVTSMVAVGALAVRQFQTQPNHASGSVAPVFAAAPLTTNPVIGVLFNATNPATMTPRTNFTERADVGYATPTTGLEIMSRDSGETATTQTWGNSSASAYASIIIELNANTAYPSVALNSPADASSGSDTTPTLAFTGTDADSDPITYEIQIDTVNTFDSLGAAMDIYDGSNVNQDYNLNTAGAGRDRGSQSFTGDGNPITKMYWWLKNPNAVSGNNVTALIYTHSGTFGTSSVPGTLLATSTSLDWGTIGPAYGWVEFTFPSPPSTVNGTKYVAVVQVSSNGSKYVGYDDSSPSHPGNATDYSGGAYTAQPGRDFSFAINAVPPYVLLDKLSASDSGFVDVTDGSDTDPFDSGDQISYTVQAGDALADDTYYWRVRGKDPAGLNDFGSWSSTRSFDISTGGGGTDWTSFPSDSVTASEAIVKAPNKKPADTATATDTIAKALVLAKADTATSNEASGRAVVHPVADSVTSSEASTHNPTLGRGESVTASDSFSKVSAFLRTFSDTATTADATPKALTHPAADTATSSDAVVKSPNVKPADSVTSSESSFRSVGRKPSDTATATDLPSKKPGLVKTDSGTSNDSSFRSVGLNKSDSVTSSDSFSRIVAFLRTFTDSVTASEAISKAIGLHKSDSASTADNATRAAAYSRTASDSVTPSDLNSKAVGLPKSDSATSADTVVKSPGLNKSDSATASESSYRAVVLVKADTASTSDDVTPESTSGDKTKSLSDSVAASDSFRVTFTKVAADSSSLSDTISKAVGLFKSDSVTSSEQMTRSQGWKRTLTDSVTPSDAVSKRPVLAKSDSVTASESSRRGVGLNKSDSASAADNFSRVVVYRRTFNDTVNAGETSAKTHELSFEESVTVSEALIKNMGLGRAEIITTIDQISKAIGLLIEDDQIVLDEVVVLLPRDIIPTKQPIQLVAKVNTVALGQREPNESTLHQSNDTVVVQLGQATNEATLRQGEIIISLNIGDN